MDMDRTMDYNLDGDDGGDNNSNGSDDDVDDNYGMDFCRGMSMTMSMKGFQSTLFFKKNNNNINNNADCLTFLFTNWKLDSPGKFSSAMIVTFLLAVLSEVITIHGQTRILTLFFRSRKKNQIYIRKFVMTLLYGIEQCLGWALMLISMTFSIELFVSVIFGIFVGKLLFPPTTKGTTTATINNSSRTTSTNTTTSNNHICCPTSDRRTWGIGQHGSDIIEPLLSQSSEHEIRNSNIDRNNTLLRGEEEEEARISPSSVNGSSTSTTSLFRRRR
mmetsp:Transcript_49732/g.57392  ORF Transcript_49732/g.57392 Transcript_49732/m.57392 type:complete len:274 (-) Transcript_49732:469-1290(-)